LYIRGYTYTSSYAETLTILKVVDCQKATIGFPDQISEQVFTIGDSPVVI
jgi:hypothetical protein